MLQWQEVKEQDYGHDGPKGTFIINTIEGKKSLFQIFCEQLKNMKMKYNAYIPWYIMTSKENNEKTVEFFENNNYFGYNKEYIKFFEQGQLPMVDTKGKVLIDENGLIKEAADGHGGVFEAMFKNHIVEDMKIKDIKWVFIGPVDNPLVNMCDEILIGLSTIKGVKAAGKSLIKKNPEEKVGIFCKKNGRPKVIEYTEITNEMANRKDENGNLVFGESHINCNMFHRDEIEKIGREKLPYHSAFKKAVFMNENREIITPTDLNSYKFESFIFDSFQRLDDMLILRVNREEEFAPIKNAKGEDSPKTAISLYNEFIKSRNKMIDNDLDR